LVLVALAVLEAMQTLVLLVQTQYFHLLHQLVVGMAPLGQAVQVVALEVQEAVVLVLHHPLLALVQQIKVLMGEVAVQTKPLQVEVVLVRLGKTNNIPYQEMAATVLLQL
jgi:hypothetical protein